MLPSILEWIGIVVGVFLLMILLPGYLATKLLRIKIVSKEIELKVVYSTGIALVSIPIVLYWVNFFGVHIDLFGVAVVLLIVFALPCAVQLGILLKRMLRISN